MRITRCLAVIPPVVSALVLLFGSPAFASVGSGGQYDNLGIGSYPNAWGGGPYIKNYNGNAANNDFTIISVGGAYGLSLTNGNSGDPYEHYCISDYGNNQNDARAGLVSCAGGGVPWGSKFTISGCSNNDGKPGLYFYNTHWRGWLDGGGSNGDQYYLNTQSATCYSAESPY